MTKEQIELSIFERWLIYNFEETKTGKYIDFNNGDTHKDKQTLKLRYNKIMGQKRIEKRYNNVTNLVDHVNKDNFDKVQKQIPNLLALADIVSNRLESKHENTPEDEITMCDLFELKTVREIRKSILG